MVADKLTWAAWLAGGEALLLMRDAYPNVSEELLGCAWRLYDAADTEEARGDALVLLAGAEEAAKEARDC